MRGFVMTVLLVLMMDVTSGQISIQLIPRYPVISGSVTLSLTGNTKQINRYYWYKGPNKNDDYEILKYSNNAKRPLNIGPLYNDRMIAFNNGSLQINNLQIKDVGNYILRLWGKNLAEVSHVILTVYEPVTKPKITASITQPKESDPLNLSCDTSVAAKITWTRNGASISSEAQLSRDNKTLTFSSVKRKESGEYQCEAGNVVGSSTSDPHTVTVAFLAEKTSKYDISNAAPEDEGQYTCVVKNEVTLHTAAANVYVTVTAEFINYTFILGLAFGLILGILVIIFGIVCLYWKIVRKRRNELLGNRQDLIDVYYNVEEALPTPAPLYMSLQCRTESIYTELQDPCFPSHTYGPCN
ncbi:cell adhesion molecule CEACAM7-like isoform X2 [Phyllobates terribilis]|uniref:cell adhesion molecule CEACAM7-like isoform X2 n=1 Tax=Phyllobates terribilis TaxID=111132 RepID=UPI003CCAF5A4